MLANFRSPNKVYARGIRSDDCEIEQGADERLGSPMGPQERIRLRLERAGQTRKATSPPSRGIRAAEQPKTCLRNTSEETVVPGEDVVSCSTARISMEAWRANNAILTPDACDRPESCCSTPHAPKQSAHRTSPQLC